jgi:hypothetical protein
MKIFNMDLNKNRASMIEVFSPALGKKVKKKGCR